MQLRKKKWFRQTVMISSRSVLRVFKSTSFSINEISTSFISINSFEHIFLLLEKPNDMGDLSEMLTNDSSMGMLAEDNNTDADQQHGYGHY